ncbi:hypothetical protein ROA7450_03394 [Roseovarius albus]|uniref:DUF2948 domain-containing protein n=1 Tax=Roseovarius albus TaxID=1247867 RepID=A0A1X6ZX72_9RHOB|nr:DUF2948 family protein [Roseovarius albus]SLN64239.1 hypothetical protein ROA7450_03394 [Roseovarius albus]
MTQDASFDDGREAPINLGAFDEEDLKIVSSLVQDAVFPITEMSWRNSERRFAILLNRFRWEDDGQQRHGAERVQSLLVVDNVLKIASQGVDRQEKDMVLSILSVEFTPSDEGAGQIELTLAGDGAIRLEVEALELTLKDVTRPYRAPSGKAPSHDA